MMEIIAGIVGVFVWLAAFAVWSALRISSEISAAESARVEGRSIDDD